MEKLAIMPDKKQLWSPKSEGAWVPSFNIAEESDKFTNSTRVQVADKILATARRQYKVLFGSLVVGALLGGAYITTATPKYTAATQILIDSKKNSSLGLAGSSAIADLNLDNGAVDSQVEILRSKKVAYAAIDDLKLEADKSRSWLSRPSWFSSEVPLTEDEIKKRERDGALGFLQRNLDIKRVGRTYVMEVAFTSTTPGKAAAVANAIAKAYIDGEVQSNFEASRRSSEWLLSRIQELKRKSLESDYAVQRFKAEKGLTSTSQNGSSVLVNEQQLVQINQQLVAARADSANARAKYERISAIMATGQMDAAVSEALGNPVILDLRNRYLAASKSEADLTARVGRDHEQAIKLRSDMKEFERLMFDELHRIAQSYKSELDIAASRERSLEASLAAQVGVSGTVNQEMVTLRELTREADTYKNLYQNMLQLYQESLQKLSLPVSGARVITAAEPPAAPSWPKPPYTIAVSLLFGAMLGGGIAVIREARDRGFRTAMQVRDDLRLEFLGMLPTVTRQQLDLVRRSPPSDGALTQPAIMEYAFRVPLSGFTETLRATRVAMDITLGTKKPKVIGVISVLPNEGKSTVTKNLASLIAHMGMKTLLIDGDLRNPSLTRDVAPRSEAGLLEVLTEGRHLKEVLLTETETDLLILPGAVDRSVTHTSQLLASSAMERLLSEAGKEFEYIFIDLPPLGPVVDARASAAYFDAFVLVIEWSKTPRDVVASALEQETMVRQKCLGAILNKVDKNTLGFYEYNKWDEYYDQTYYRDHSEIPSIPSLSPVHSVLSKIQVPLRRVGKFLGATQGR